MKVCIFGAGAIGGYLGAEMSRAGADVSLVARGAHLEAMRRDGVRVIKESEEFVARPVCTSDTSELGVQDYVIIGLKAHQIAAAVPALRPLMGSHTSVVAAVNGIPYWYFHRHGGKHDGKVVESVDPGGVQWSGIGPERAIGCIVYPATEIEQPGVIRHI